MALTRVLFITFFTTAISNLHLSAARKTVGNPETRSFLGFGTTSLTQRPCICVSTVSCSCCETVKIFYTGEAKRLCFNMIYQTNGLNFDLSLDTLMLKSMTVANYRPFQMCAPVPGLLFSSICVSILELNQFPRSFTICPRVDVIAKQQRWYISYVCSSISNQLPGTPATAGGTAAAMMPAVAGGGTMATVPAAMGMMMAGAGAMTRPGAATPPAGPATGQASMMATMPAAAAGTRPAGAMPAGMIPAGMMPAGMMPAAMMPAAMMPAAMMPAGMMPAGMMPAGMRPAGMMPAGMMPAGMMPAGTMPGGAAMGQRPAGAPAPMTPTAPMPPPGGSPPAGGAAPPGGTPAPGGSAPPPGAMPPAGAPPGAMPPAGAPPPGVIMPRPGGPPISQPRLAVSARVTKTEAQQLLAENVSDARETTTFDKELMDLSISDVERDFSHIPESTSKDNNNVIQRRENTDTVVKREIVEKKKMFMSDHFTKRTIQTENDKSNDVVSEVLKRDKRQAYDMFDLFHQSNRCQRAYRICITRSRNYIVSRLKNVKNGPKTKNNCFDKPARIVYGSAEDLCPHVSEDTASEEVTLSSISEAADTAVENSDSSLEAIVVHDEPIEGADVYPQSGPYIVPITSYNRQDYFPMRTPPLVALQIKQQLSRISNDTLIFRENPANNFNNQELVRPVN